jgi:hypothetical protein
VTREFPPGEDKEWRGLGHRLWYLSSRRMTFGVVTAQPSDRIVEAPPLARRFLGQQLGSLVAWMSNQPGFARQLIGTAGRPVPGHQSARAAAGALRTAHAAADNPNPSSQGEPGRPDVAKATRLVGEGFPTGPSASAGRPHHVADADGAREVLPEAAGNLARPDLHLAQAARRAPGAEP